MSNVKFQIFKVDHEVAMCCAIFCGKKLKNELASAFCLHILDIWHASEKVCARINDKKDN